MNILVNLIKPAVKVTAAKSTKAVTSVTSKKVNVNPDGTIAESLDSYRQFCADLNNRSYGW